MQLHFGRAGLCGLAGLAAAGTWAEGAGDTRRLPAELFARRPQFEQAALSPDGASLGYIIRKDDNAGVGFLDMASMKAETIWARRDNTYRFRNDIGFFQWVGNNRVVVSTSQGWVGLNRDASGFIYLSGAGRWTAERSSGQAAPMDFFPDQVVCCANNDPRKLLVLSRPKDAGEEQFFPEVFRLDTLTGSFGLVQKNPGKVTGWLADWEGNIRFGFMSDLVSTQLIHRDSPDAPWGKPIHFGTDTKRFDFAGIDADGRTLYFFKPAAGGRKALYAYDLKEGRLSEPLFQHDKYDVTAAIFSPKHRRLLGVRYTTEGPRQYWFEPELAQLQKEIDASHPGLVNLIVSMDWEMRRMLVFSYSARESGYYTLLDLGTHKSQVIALTRPWFKAEDMAEMFPIKCRARDGVELNGYLSLPPGRGQKNLPAVVFVHGGPWVRDVWGFDPIVQFLANRGYAVLQINYRGSTGYGEPFYDLGRNEVGGKIQDDITDAARWAVKQGFADPRRLAIMGASYGGYSALFALAKTPDLYRCGVAAMAVTDWNAFYKYKDADDYQYAFRYWRNRVGDLQDEKVRRHLAEVSPVNLAGQIKAPVFILHGEDDNNVPLSQAQHMVAALRKAGQQPETLFVPETGHWWPQEEKGTEFLTRLEAFLAAHLGAP